MARWRREWAADWNGRGEPLAEAIEAARDAFDWPSSAKIDVDLVWDRMRGVRASYSRLDEAKERLAVSAPPREGKLRLYHPDPEEIDPEDIFMIGREERAEMEVRVDVAATQVTVSAFGPNPFLALAAFEAARKVIERKAVTTVPHHVRRGPADETSWTRAAGWIEQHPALLALIVGAALVTVAIVGLIIGGGGSE